MPEQVGEGDTNNAFDLFPVILGEGMPVFDFQYLLEKELKLVLVSSPTVTDGKLTPRGLETIAQSLQNRDVLVGVIPVLCGLKEPLELSPNVLRMFDALNDVTESVGFSVFDTDLAYIREFFRMTEERFNRGERTVKTVYLGGVGICDNFPLWEERMRRAFADFSLEGKLEICLVRGEAEEVMPRLINGERDLPGIHIISNNGNCVEAPEPLRASVGTDGYISGVPVVNSRHWQIFSGVGKITERIAYDIREILDRFENGRSGRCGYLQESEQAIYQINAELFAGIEASRGCPLRCNYCAQSATSLTSFSPQYVAAQMEELLLAGRTHLSFADDNFMTEPTWWKELARLVEKKGINDYMTFQGTTHPNSLRKFSADDLKMMARTGLRSLAVGLQSTYPPELKRMGRNPRSVDFFLEKVRDLREAGIRFWIDMINGYPGWDLDLREQKESWADFREKAKAQGGGFGVRGRRIFAPPGRPRDRLSDPKVNLGMGLLDALYLADWMPGGNNEQIEGEDILNPRGQNLAGVPFGRFGTVFFSRDLIHGQRRKVIEVGHPSYGKSRIYKGYPSDRGLQRISDALVDSTGGRKMQDYNPLHLVYFLSLLAINSSGPSALRRDISFYRKEIERFDLS